MSDPETDPSNLSGLPGSSETVSDQRESGDVLSESLSETESETESEIDTEYVRDTEPDTVISSAEKEKDPPATGKTETTTEEKTETEPADTTEETEMKNDITDKCAFASGNYVLSDFGVRAELVTTSSSNIIYGGAFFEDPAASGNYRLKVSLRTEARRSLGGLLFGAKKSGKGFAGYSFSVSERSVALSKVSYSGSKEVRTELASKTVERSDYNKPVTLMVEKSGSRIRCYYLDDMAGVEPWPEFEYVLSDTDGGIGYFDNGYGVSFEEIEIEPYVSSESTGKKYVNPVFGNNAGADPFVLKYNGVYYLYCSNYAPNNLGHWVFTSTDLVNWTMKGQCAGEMWGAAAGTYWAPEVFEKDGKFYMVVTAGRHIGFAVADSPLGPFIPEDNYITDGIDGHVFEDEDGRMYLYYVYNGIHGCELNDDIVTVKPGTDKLLFRASAAWEVTTAEGPFVVKHNGKYYLTYSGDTYTSENYAVGYATSDSPLGDYVRYAANPVMNKTSVIHGTGHHCFVSSPDGSEMFIVFHCHKAPGTVGPRTICIDRVRFAPTACGVDRIEVFGPTHTPQDYPG
ncbi:MAG: glycoside hydrolase family 43 protein [Clostridia bacterium]|nr:glycoside hydrolase family 43 protein [Clostridia bacterium]